MSNEDVKRFNDNKRSRKDLDSSTEGDNMSNNEILQTLKDMDSRFLSKIDTLENSIDSRLSSKIDILQSNLLAIVNGVKEELNEKLNAVSKSCDKRLVAVEKAFVQLENRCDDLAGSLNGAANGHSTEIETRLSKLERHSLMNELIVTGIPLEKRRSVDDVVADICEALQCDLRQSDFTAIFRLTSRKQRNNQNGDGSQRTVSPPIILRLNYLWAKNQILDAYYKKKDLNLKDIGFKTAKRIYINESLTVSNREIFKTAMELKKSGNIFRCFTRQGLVYIQKTESGSTIKVISQQNLDKIIGDDSSSKASQPANQMDT